jgi:hypothetical protein
MGIHAETTVLTDEKFPYRVVCNSEWIQQEKNDTMLIIRNTASGKKTRLQLKKYDVDSNFNWNTKEWSRWRYVINSDMIIQLGKIGFVDTSASKKLGGYRAYEIFAFFWEKTDDETLWLAEYIRWTDNNGSGYMASIFGDTLDMKENIKNKSYVHLLDSISLSFFQTGTVVEKNNHTKMIIRQSPDVCPVWYDLLGRNLNDFYLNKPDMVIVKKDMKFHSLR